MVEKNLIKSKKILSLVLIGILLLIFLVKNLFISRPTELLYIILYSILGIIFFLLIIDKFKNMIAKIIFLGLILIIALIAAINEPVEIRHFKVTAPNASKSILVVENKVYLDSGVDYKIYINNLGFRKMITSKFMKNERYTNYIWQDDVVTLKFDNEEIIIDFGKKETIKLYDIFSEKA